MIENEEQMNGSPPAFIVYLDGSGDEELAVFSALSIPIASWRACFNEVKQFRTDLKRRHGIFMRKELHAWEFVSGRGRYAPERIGIPTRVDLYFETLGLVAGLPGARLFSACFPQDQENVAFERLLNRIERTVEEWKGHALIISDEGKEGTYTKMARKMTIHNPIPSRYGFWESGTVTKNIPLTRIVEDIVFRKSERSYFIQLADFCAYALLRSERQLASKNKWGLHKAFDVLDPILVKEIAWRDSRGILRDKYGRPKR